MCELWLVTLQSLPILRQSVFEKRLNDRDNLLVLYHFRYLDDEKSVVDCVIGCSKVNKDCSTDLLLFISIFYVLSKVQELSTSRASWSKLSIFWVNILFVCCRRAIRDCAFVRLVESA